MRPLKKLLFGEQRNKNRREVDRTTHRPFEFGGFVYQYPDTVKHLESECREEVHNQTAFYEKRNEALVVRKCPGIDKDLSHEHHDLIVGKGDGMLI